jgi:hypothetical protein
MNNIVGYGLRVEKVENFMTLAFVYPLFPLKIRIDIPNFQGKIIP